MKINVTPKILNFMQLHFYLYDNIAYVFHCFQFLSPVMQNLNQVQESSTALKADPCTSTQLHMAAGARAGSSPAPLQGLESQLQELEGILHHLVLFLTLLQETDSLALHLEPFKILSGSASEERSPTVFWPYSVCVLSQKSGYWLLSFLALGVSGWAISPMRW